MSYRYCYEGGVAPSTLNPANRETMLGACVNILRPTVSLWANRLYSVGKGYTPLITARLHPEMPLVCALCTSQILSKNPPDAKKRRPGRRVQAARETRLSTRAKARRLAAGSIFVKLG